METNKNLTISNLHKEVMFHCETPDVERQAILPPQKTETAKSVKVLYVIIYLMAVSFLAILLSSYYVFFWEARPSAIEEIEEETIIGSVDDD